MRVPVTTVIAILMMGACVDRIDIDVSKPKSDAIVISGFISDGPGPYEIRIQNVYDVESKETTRVPVSVKRLELSDDAGNTEIMTEVKPGFYQTSATGMQGVSGRAYKINVELYDGRIYESWPDTIKTGAELDSMYYVAHDVTDELGRLKSYLDVRFDATYDATANVNYIWKFRGTFKADTQPELYFSYHIGPAGNYTGLCFFLDELPGCNLQPPCSGLRNIGNTRLPEFEQRFPCTCCTCWYDIVNENLLLNNEKFIDKGIISGRLAGSIPINMWTLLYKIRLSVEQHSLTRNSFRFYKAIQDQKDAIGSLFQPVTGEIPSNFTQLSGPAVRVEGLFYATSVSSKVMYVTKYDLPAFITSRIPETKPIFPDDCRYLFPNSTNIRPPFWID
jgi:hypothetical protein